MGPKFFVHMFLSVVSSERLLGCLIYIFSCCGGDACEKPELVNKYILEFLKNFSYMPILVSSNICEQHRDENVISKPMDSANWMASSVGKAMALTPAFTANVSVLIRCLPFGLMHPKTIGV